MENVVIYEDDNLRVEIAGWFDYYLKNIHVPSIKLEDKHFKSLLPFLNARLPQDKHYSISYWGQAPIFQFDRYIHFEPPFDVFMDAQYYISSQICDVAEEPKKAERDIEELYATTSGEFVSYIFYEKIHEIQGFFAYVDDESSQITVMFWGYQPPTEDDINLESV